MCIVKLLQGDCLELMKKIPDNSVDMILCDLPYKETGNKWDKRFVLDKCLQEYERIIKKDGCIALSGTFRFGVQLFNLMPHCINMIGYGRRTMEQMLRMLIINLLEYMNTYIYSERVE